MNKIARILTSLHRRLPAKDKIDHFCSGYVLGSVPAFIVVKFVDASPILGTCLALLPLMIGVVKELADLYDGDASTNPEPLDAVATALGGVLGVLSIFWR